MLCVRDEGKVMSSSYKGLDPKALSPLRCDRCGASLFSSNSTRIEIGTVACGCFVYPVVAGVLILERGAVSGAIAEAILCNDDLRLRALTNKYLGLAEPSIPDSHKHLSQALDDYVSANSDEAERSKEWLVHVRNWKATPKYLAAVRLKSCLNKLPDLPVLDLAAGYGHLSDLYRDEIGERPLYLLDANLAQLVMSFSLLSERQLASATFIASKINGGIPFASNSLGAVINADSFYAFSEQGEVLQHCGRSLGENGVLLFTHLHNRNRFDEPFQENSHSKEEWNDIFSASLGLEVSTISDDALRCSLHYRSSLNTYELVDDNPKSFSVVAPKVDLIEAVYDDDIFVSGVQFNPIFDVQRVSSGFELRRKSTTKLFAEEHDINRFPTYLQVSDHELASEPFRASLFANGMIVIPDHLLSRPGD
jgi:SAM-dependent methyltransferase